MLPNVWNTLDLRILKWTKRAVASLQPAATKQVAIDRLDRLVFQSLPP